jgi:hypothetical protein
MSYIGTKLLSGGLAIFVGAHGTIGFAESIEGSYSCVKVYSVFASPCIPTQDGPRQEIHVDPLGSSSTVAMIWSFPPSPNAVVLEQALPKGGQYEFCNAGHPTLSS